jgi:hypothetical protein
MYDRLPHPHGPCNTNNRDKNGLPLAAKFRLVVVFVAAVVVLDFDARKLGGEIWVPWVPWVPCVPWLA